MQHNFSINMSEFSISDLQTHFNPSGWGPSNGEPLEEFSAIPYAHFDKKERTWRAADFSAQGQAHSLKNPYAGKYRPRDDLSSSNAEFTYRHDTAEDLSFHLVDSSKGVKKYPSNKKGWTSGRGGRGGMRGGRGGQSGIRGMRDGSAGGSGAGGLSSRGGMMRGGRLGMRGRGGRRSDRKQDRQPSLSVLGNWEVRQEFDLSQLLKLQANPPVVEDLLWAGHLDLYEDAYDKITTKTARPLQRFDNKVFYYSSTSDDSVLNNFASTPELANVYATDAILALLMASPRSVYSWDLVVQKFDGMIFIDKRANSTFDFLTVSETAHDPPSYNEDSIEMNHPDRLCLEATSINQNFSQQILKENDGTSRKCYEPNPFFDKEEDGSAGFEAASVAYRYRKFTLGNIKVIARCELHGWSSKGNDSLLFTAYALNEWDSRYSGGIDWRAKIDQQRGAVLATELKNNSCKLARWTAQSVLAGADLMRLGYVSRLNRANCYEHAILATQVFKPKDLSAQINLTPQNMWGVVKMISEMLLEQEDGKYVLMKDPNKATVRLYSVPLDTFEEADEEEEEEEEEEDGEVEADEEDDDDEVEANIPVPPADVAGV